MENSFPEKQKAKKKVNFALTLIGGVFIILVGILYMLSSKPSNDQIFQLVSIHPNTTIITSMWSTEPITFEFNMPIDKNSIKLTIEPSINTKITQNEGLARFSVVPLDGWSEGVQYKITISPELQSRTGVKLKEQISHSFKRQVDYNNLPAESGQEKHAF